MKIANAAPTFTLPFHQPRALEVEHAPDRFVPGNHQELGIYKRVYFPVKTGGAASPSATPKLDTRPRSEAEQRKYFATQAPHHDLIAGRDYGKAADAYRKDAERLPEGDPQRKLFEQRATQLEFTAKMGDASFPPTFDEVKAHFRGLKEAPAKQVSEEFRSYSKAFYDHIQHVDRKADVVYDREKGKIRGEKGSWVTHTPEDFKDVTDKRQTSADGRRLIDCEGYAWMGEQLLKEAGFRQPKEGGYLLMQGKDEAHVMVTMERGDESLTVSNDRAYMDYARALDSSRQALDLPTLDGVTVYYGRKEKEAIAHASERNKRFSFEVQVGR